MKFILIIGALVGCCCPGLCFGQTKTLSITGNLKGLSPSTELVITHYSGAKLDTTARVKSVNGSFTMKVNTGNYPQFYFLKIVGNKTSLTLFLDAGKINITGGVAKWPKVQVNGSESHHIYQQYQDVIAEAEAKGKALTQQYNSLIGSTDSTAIANVKQELSGSIANYAKLQQDFVKANPDAFYSAVIINNAKWDWMDKRTAYEKLTLRVKNSTYGIMLVDNIAKWKKNSGLLEVGEIVPDFNANTLGSSELNLRKELADNKLTLIDFWASWCVPCRQENPNLIRVYQENKVKGFDIIGVSLDEKETDWKQAISKDGLPWAQVSDLKGWASPIAKLYFAGMPFNFIPQNFLVDAKGKILARNLRSDQLSKKVEELLKGGNL